MRSLFFRFQSFLKRGALVKGFKKQGPKGFRPPQALKGPKGQILVFLILVFDVLFVFFGLSINSALVIHDKINLQNAADLSAIYGAQKQAELLNAIAHENYMIRQAWKLLVWRYAYLGGWSSERPVVDRNIGNPPVACVSHHATYRHYPPNKGGNNFSDIMCNYERPSFQGLTAATVTKIPGIAPFYAGAVEGNRDLGDTCDKAHYLNWLYPQALLLNFYEEQKKRKVKIQALATKLIGGEDLQGDLIQDGVLNTLYKNLTYANRQGFLQAKFYNSMEINDLKPKDFLVDIPIYPLLYYRAYQGNAEYGSCTNSGDDGKSLPHIHKCPTDSNCQDLANEFDDPTTQKIEEIVKGNRYLLGLEKNPWYMVYSGVQVQTYVKEIFSFKRTLLKAEAFAKPFGGRIGPWYAKTWPANLNRSWGAQVDRLAPKRNLNPPGQDFKISKGDIVRYIPNHSRYPGDTQGAWGQDYYNYFNAFSSDLFRDHNSQMNVIAAYMDRDGKWDPLSLGNETISSPRQWCDSSKNLLRHREYTAAVPDLFDITYYSISPFYWKHYVEQVEGSKGEGLDHSCRKVNQLYQQTPGRSELHIFVMELNQQRLQTRSTNLFSWKISRWQQLLTGWQPMGPGFRTDETEGRDLSSSQSPQHMMRCNVFDSRASYFPSDCVLGGRSGYSVKLISRNFLSADNLELGGKGQTGSIKNPPPPPL